jgi:hypothetical protein
MRVRWRDGSLTFPAFAGSSFWLFRCVILERVCRL